MRRIVRSWVRSGGYPEQVGRPHHPDARPLGVALSAGGFRSYSCAIGQLRGLATLGLMDHVGVLSAVSGGAWAATAYAFAPAEVSDSVRLGSSLDPEQLTLDALDEMPEGALGWPVTVIDSRAVFEQLRADLHVSPDRLFGGTLAAGILDQLGIDGFRPVLAQDRLHRMDLLARNPELSVEDVLMPREDRPFVVAGAALVRDPGRFQHHVPIELSAMYATVPRDLVFTGDVGFVETLALYGEAPTLRGQRTAEIEARPGGFGLADLWAATGMAPGSALVRLSRRFGWQLDGTVPRVAQWVAPLMPHTSQLVDGGTVEPLGVVPLLERGFERIVVFVNGTSTVGSRASDCVDGVDGQITRLFGRPPTGGFYADDPLHLFAPADLQAVIEGLKESKARGELPWHLGDIQVTGLNQFGLHPRTVKILWMCNEMPAGFAARLPEATRAELRKSLTSDLASHPHYRVAFTNGFDMFRMTPRQVNLLAHQWDFAVRAREHALEALCTEPLQEWSAGR